MLEVILDTETTGLSITEKHRIVEIGCIELENQIPTYKIFHEYLNPQRLVSEDAYKIHGYSDDFLSDKKTFSEISEDFLNFIKKNKNKKLIILDIPLLMENKINKKNDVLIFVDAKKNEINKRLKNKLNINLKIIEKFKKLQLPVELKKQQSDFIIKNNFKNNSIKKNVKKVLEKILLNA